MTLAQSLTAIIIFWAIIGGLGASLLLPGDAVADPRQLRGRRAEAGLRAGRRRGRDRRRGRAAARRVRHDLPVVAGRVRARGRHHRSSCSARSGSSSDVPYTGSRHVDVVGAVLSVVGMGGVVLGHPGLAGGRRVRRAADGRSAPWRSCALAWWLRPAQARRQRVTLLDPDLFRHPNFTAGVSGQMLQQITLGGAMIALPLFLQMTLEYNALRGRPVARAAVADACSRRRCSPASGPGTGARPRSSGPGSLLASLGHGVDHPVRPARRTAAGTSSLPLVDRRLRARPAGVAAQQLHARARSRRSGSARRPA